MSRGQGAEVGDQKRTEDRGRRTGDRGQGDQKRTEDSGLKTDIRGQPCRWLDGPASLIREETLFYWHTAELFTGRVNLKDFLDIL